MRSPSKALPLTCLLLESFLQGPWPLRDGQALVTGCRPRGDRGPTLSLGSCPRTSRPHIYPPLAAPSLVCRVPGVEDMERRQRWLFFSGCLGQGRSRLPAKVQFGDYL